MTHPLRRPTSRRRLPVALAASALLLAACSGGEEPAAAPSPVTTSASPSASPTPPPPPPPPPPPNPLTGQGAQPSAPAVALKVDNGVLARPFLRGLEQAPVVYQELAEGGATRFLAVFDEGEDIDVGPIRSVRESDLQLLGQYGKVVFGFSGGNDGVLRTVRRAQAAGAVVEVSYDTHRDLYRRAEKRKDAFNFYVRPSQLAAAGAGGGPVRDIGLRFGANPPDYGALATSGRAVFSKLSTVTFTWDAASNDYGIAQDGTPMQGYRPTNVVVQQVQIAASPYKDVLGNPTPDSVTVGSGPVTVLRNGRRADGTWNRPDAASPTSFVDGTGQPLLLEPGSTLVLLLPAGQPVVTG